SRAGRLTAQGVVDRPLPLLYSEGRECVERLPRGTGPVPDAALTEASGVDKRGKNPKRSWLINGPWVLLLLLAAGLTYFLFNREPAALPLKYGELVEILSAARGNSAVSVQDVRVGHNDIRGKLVFTDPVTDGDKDAPRTRVVAFRTMRLGLENDQGL